MLDQARQQRQGEASVTCADGSGTSPRLLQPDDDRLRGYLLDGWVRPSDATWLIFN